MAYRVGIVGASGIVINTPRGEPSPPLGKELYLAHVGSLSTMPDVELAGICDINPEALERFRSAWSGRWPETRLYADYREMLDKESLDILTVATSDHLHAKIVIDGAESGVKGIFCEKPIATTLEDADAMIAACERNGVKMSVNHSRRWIPLYHKVRQVIRSGRYREADGDDGGAGRATRDDVSERHALYRRAVLLCRVGAEGRCRRSWRTGSMTGTGIAGTVGSCRRTSRA